MAASSGVVLARIRYIGQGGYAGCGFLIDHQYVVTCTHVLITAGNDKELTKGMAYTVDFPFASQKEIQLELVDFFPVMEGNVSFDDLEDLALLRFKSGKLPDGLPSSPPVKFPGYDEQAKNAIEIYSAKALSYVQGQCMGPTQTGWLALSTSSDVEPGDSGSPVWNVNFNAITGMLVARKLGKLTCYVIPTIKIRTAFQQYIRQISQANHRPISENSFLLPEQRAAWINRTEQWDEHIADRIAATGTAGKPFAFIIAGVLEEWPESLEQRMCKELKTKAMQIKPAFTGKYTQRKECGFWSSVLAYLLDKDQLDQLELQNYEQTLIDELSNSPNSQLFCWQLHPSLKEHLDINIITDLVHRWESLALKKSSKPHFLMIFYGCVERGFFKIGERKVENWRQQLIEKLAETANKPRIVTPKLKSPQRTEINWWVKEFHTDVADQIKVDKALNKIKGDCIPHKMLLETYIDIDLSKTKS